MRVLGSMVVAVALACLAAGAGGADPKPALEALAPLPAEAVGFFHIPSIERLEQDLRRFAERTGWKLGRGDQPVREALRLRTDLAAGLDPAGSAAIAWLDPKQFRNRYTVYVLPVADWDKLLEAAAAEPMGPGLYALTRVRGPRFVSRRGRFALVTSSFRTMEAVGRAERRLPDRLPEATLGRAAEGGPYLYLDTSALRRIYADEIASWFRASTGQVYRKPEMVAYADIFITYFLGIAKFFDQVERVEAGLRLGADGLGAQVRVEFRPGEPVAEFLSAQPARGAPAPILGPGPVTSAVTVQLDPAARTDAALRATRFYLEKAPRPEPLPEATKEAVYEAVRTFLESLGERITFLSAPPPPGAGLASDVTVYDLKDPAKFQEGLQRLAQAWEALAEHLGIYMKIEVGEDDPIAEAPVTRYVPKMRFGIPARHAEFRERMRALYGEEDLVYRVAVVGRHAVVGLGRDPSLMQAAIEAAKAGKPPEPPPALARLARQLPAQQNVSIVTSLPFYLRQSLIRGGTPLDRIGSVDPGAELAGAALRFEGGTAVLGSYWPYEQVRLARELLERAAPDLKKAPESLFEPPEEGPPEGLPPAAPAPPPPEGTAPAPPAAAPVEPPPAPPAEPAP